MKYPTQAGLIVMLITVLGSITLKTKDACGALRDRISYDDRHVGKEVHFDIPLIYFQDCVGCGGSGEQLRINRQLSCLDEMRSLGPHLFKDNLKNVQYVRSNEHFKVVAVDKIGVTGLDAIEGEGYNLAILEDRQGQQSIALLSQIDRAELNPIEFCINHPDRYLTNLFKYAENVGKTDLLVTLYDLHSQKSDSAVQESFLTLLKPALNRYSFGKIQKVDSPTSGMVGVTLEPNVDALAYLVASRLDLHIWRLEGTDANFKNQLSPEDQQSLRDVPSRRIIRLPK